MIPRYTDINWVSSQEVEGMDLASIENTDLRKIGLALALGQCEQTLCISGQKCGHEFGPEFTNPFWKCNLGSFH